MGGILLNAPQSNVSVHGHHAISLQTEHALLLNTRSNTEQGSDTVQDKIAEPYYDATEDNAQQTALGKWGTQDFATPAPTDPFPASLCFYAEPDAFAYTLAKDTDKDQLKWFDFMANVSSIDYTDAKWQVENVEFTRKSRAGRHVSVSADGKSAIVVQDDQTTRATAMQQSLTAAYTAQVKQIRDEYEAKVIEHTAKSAANAQLLALNPAAVLPPLIPPAPPLALIPPPPASPLPVDDCPQSPGTAPGVYLTTTGNTAKIRLKHDQSQLLMIPDLTTLSHFAAGNNQGGGAAVNVILRDKSIVLSCADGGVVNSSITLNKDGITLEVGGNKYVFGKDNLKANDCNILSLKDIEISGSDISTKKRAVTINKQSVNISK
jgi:hypothetical protein